MEILLDQLATMINVVSIIHSKYSAHIKPLYIILKIGVIIILLLGLSTVETKLTHL